MILPNMGLSLEPTAVRVPIVITNLVKEAKME